MKTPLYLNHKSPSSMSAEAHTGLWFDKFCNQWPETNGKPSWSLKAFSTGHGKDRQDHNPKLDWIKTVAPKSVGKPALLTEHASRLAAFAAKLGGLSFLFTTTSPFATGLGREHPIENGFVWHPSLGIPYLPGSSVKGLIRAWIESGWEEAADFHRIFGSDYRKGSDNYDKERHLTAQSGSVIFLDAIPTAPVPLKADVMTPHYGDYYEGKSPPADWLSPNPIPFLSVAPGATFQFALVPRTAEGAADVEKIAAWLEKALAWLGAGAKTAVGYGRFERDVKKEAAISESQKAARQKAEAETALAASLAGKSELAQEFEKAAFAAKWKEAKNAFAAAGVIEGWLTRLEADPQPDAIHCLRELMDSHFPGLLANPDKTEGKKNTPVFKDRQRNLAKRLNKLAQP